MNDILKNTSGAIKETWTKGTDFLIEAGADWLKPRTTFALMFYFSYVYLSVKGLKVPDGLELIVGSLLGYFFGTRGQQQVNGKPNP